MTRRTITVTTSDGARTTYLRTPLGILPTHRTLPRVIGARWEPRGGDIDPPRNLAQAAAEERRMVDAALRGEA